VAIIARVGESVPLAQGLEDEFELDADAAGEAEADAEGFYYAGEFLPRPASDDVDLVLATTGGAAATEEGAARGARTPFSRLFVGTLHRDPAVRDALFRLVHFGASVERRPRRRGSPGATISDASR